MTPSTRSGPGASCSSRAVPSTGSSTAANHAQRPTDTSSVRLARVNGYERRAAVVSAAVFVVVAGLAAPVTARTAATHHRPARPLKCARGKTRVFATRGTHPKLVSPASATVLPSRGQRKFCLKTSTSATAGQSAGTLAGTAFSHAVAQLPKRLRPHLRRLGPAFERAVAASFTGSAMHVARRREAATAKDAPTTFNAAGKGRRQRDRGRQRGRRR